MTIDTPRSGASPRREMLAGVRAVLPIIVGDVSFGLIYGAAALGAGLSASQTLATSALVNSGSAQLVGARLLGSGAAGGLVVLTTLVLGLRHVLYSASLAPRLAAVGAPGRLVLAHLVTDESYAVAAARRDDRSRSLPWFLLGAGATLWLSWLASTLAGLWAGARIPAGVSLEAAVPLTFLALLLPTLERRADVAASAIAAVVAVGAAGFPLRLGLFLAMIAGIGAGLVADAKEPAS